jgi:hypothetical protein
MENTENIHEAKDLTPCPNCSRKFLQDRLEVHLRACKAPPKKGSLTTSMDSKALFMEKLEKQMKSEGGGESSSGTGTGTGGSTMKPNRPMSLICYVCGKEFGTQSLNFHLKTCETNFLRDHQSLPDKPPAHDTIMSKKNLDYEEICQYNTDAEKIFKDVNHHPCPNCGRKFLTDRLEVHLKGCKPSGKTTMSKGFGKSPERKTNDVTSNSTKLLEEKLNKQLGTGGGGKGMSSGSGSGGMGGGGANSGGFGNKPLFLMCYCCGREFGKHSLEIHLKTCLEKFENEEKGKRKMPNMPDELANMISKLSMGDDITNDEMTNYNDVANNIYKEYSMKKCPGCGRRFLPDRLEVHLKSCKEAANSDGERKKSPGQGGRPRMLMCPLCGREFGTMSLSIHMKTCRIKFEIEQQKLPKNLRRNADKIIEKFEESNKAIKSSDGNYNMDKMNDGAYEIFSKEALVPCDTCGRTFLPDRLLVHQRSCKKKS